jgi:hypothetical protein
VSGETIPSRHSTLADEARRAARPLRLHTLLALLLFACLDAGAQSLAITQRGEIVVAHDGKIDVFAPNSTEPPVSTFAGLRSAALTVAGGNRVAVLDPLTDAVRLIDLQNGRDETLEVAATPVAAVFIGSDLYVVCRDGRVIERIGSDSSRATLPTGIGPEVIRLAGGHLYVYSRIDGLLQEVSAEPFRVVQEVHIAPFASDLEVDDASVYAVYPREGIIRTFAAGSLEAQGQTRVGAVPVDLAIISGTAVSARNLLVADPASKRVWMIEGKQSAAEAFARGFLRGLIGLGLSRAGVSLFPTGIDRICVVGPVWLAYDSSSRTLYRFSRSQSDVIARDVAPAAFDVRDGHVIFFQGGTLVAEKPAR